MKHPLCLPGLIEREGTYRFLANEQVRETDILAGHFQSIRDRADSAECLMFLIRDTMSSPISGNRLKRPASPKA